MPPMIDAFLMVAFVVFGVYLVVVIAMMPYWGDWTDAAIPILVLVVAGLVAMLACRFHDAVLPLVLYGYLLVGLLVDRCRRDWLELAPHECHADESVCNILIWPIFAPVNLIDLLSAWRKQKSSRP